jgi:hypothetical protein
MRRMADDVVTMEKIVALCKRRGLIFPASEIYGGIANTYDYGHYGVLLKRNVIDAWWQSMIGDRTDIVALDSAISPASPTHSSTARRAASATAPTIWASCRADASRPSTPARRPSATSPRRASST